MVASSTKFSDIQNHWARPFIEGLAQRGIVSGFPDGSFRPNQSMSRVEFAAILNRAFSLPPKRQYVPFQDIPATHWAAKPIQKAFETGFLAGFPDQSFRPNDKIARVQILVSLVTGLGIVPSNIANLTLALPNVYQDTAQIPQYGLDKVAAATGAGIVVNYPNIKILNPNNAATRGEVAAFIYQALVNLGQLAKINSAYIVSPPDPVTIPKTVKVSHQREFRGTWVASVWNEDWPSAQGLSVAQQKAELIKILDLMQSLKLNALILQVRPEGDALYASKLDPWSAWLTGKQGQAPSPFYDPLEFAIAESHKRNIELHAWFNPYRAKVSTKQPPNVSPHISVTNPEYVYPYGNGLWMDPGAKVIQDRVYNVVMDVVQRYDVDAIHLDDYFYPYPIEGQFFPDSKTYAVYKNNGGLLSLADWRRANVNQMIQRLGTGIRATKSYVKFGVSPFGIYRPGQPPQIKGLDAYSELYADSKKWLEQGWVDYLAPQLYWRTDQPGQSYPVLLKWWTEQNLKRRHIYPGNNISALDGKSWTLAEIQQQVKTTRQLASQLALGNIFFSMQVLLENRQGIVDGLKTAAYTQPALVPAMSWLNSTSPPLPIGVEAKGGKLVWQSGNNANLRYWTLYKQNANAWTLLKILPATVTTVTVEPGIYALCAVERTANESEGVVVSVP